MWSSCVGFLVQIRTDNKQAVQIRSQEIGRSMSEVANFRTGMYWGRVWIPSGRVYDRQGIEKFVKCRLEEVFERSGRVRLKLVKSQREIAVPGWPMVRRMRCVDAMVMPFIRRSIRAFGSSSLFSSFSTFFLSPLFFGGGESSKASF